MVSLSGKNFQNFGFWGAKVFSSFFFLGSVRFCLRAWPLQPRLPRPNTAASGQPCTAMIWSCSGSSRPRRPWMRKTTRALASDDDSGGNLLRHGSLWGSGCNADCSRFFCGYLLTLYGKWAKSICRNGVVSMFSASCVYRQGILYSRFLFCCILERPLQSKMDPKFSSPFYGPWHSDFYQQDSVKCVPLKILWSQSKGYLRLQIVFVVRAWFANTSR